MKIAGARSLLWLERIHIWVLINPRPLPLRVTSANPATLREDLHGRDVLEPRTHFLRRYRALIAPASTVSKPQLTEKPGCQATYFSPSKSDLAICHGSRSNGRRDALLTNLQYFCAVEPIGIPKILDEQSPRGTI
jgi:hypothetical protein